MPSVIGGLRAVRDALDSILMLPEHAATVRYRDASSGVPGANAFAGLHPQSLALASVRVGSLPPMLNIVLPQYALSAMFAGTKTALEVGLKLAQTLGCAVRIIALTGRLTSSRRREIRGFMNAEFGVLAASIDAVVSSAELTSLRVGESDLWLATHWVTAHALDVAVRLSLIDVKRVVYLVQDYEPGFNAWSSEFAIARSTYRAGFTLLVNSTLLADYLGKHEALIVDPDLVFRPRLDLKRLEECAGQRERPQSGTTRLLFYARPNKPRNLYTVGMSALALTSLAVTARGGRLSISSAGARHRVPKTGPLRNMEMLGKLSWAQYFESLARADVVLALQHSPHPSHPPLDAVVSGGWAVTNDFDGGRSELHERLIASRPDPGDLRDALLRAIDGVRDSAVQSRFTLDLVEKLGARVDDVIMRLALRIEL